MEMKNWIAVFLGIVISGLILASMTPIIASSIDEETTKTFTNDDTYRMSPVGEDTIIVHYKDRVFTVNGVDYPVTGRPITQNDTVMVYSSSTTNRAGYLYVINEEDGYQRFNIGNSYEQTITYDGSNKTVEIVTVTSNGTYTDEFTYTNEVYYADENGSFIWSGQKPNPTYVTDELPSFNCWSNEDTDFYSVMNGVVKHNGVVVDTATIDRQTSKINYIVGVEYLTDYSIKLTDDSDSINCRGYILPLEVVGTNTFHSSTADIIALLPLVMGVGLLIVAIGVFITNRYS